MTQISQSVPRLPGRPNRTSREQIVAATLAMLAADGMDGFTMSKVARRIDVAVMTLYNYFSSRDALLDAAAEAIFSNFRLPIDEVNWEAKLTSWLYALLALFERHPIGIKLIKWDEHVAPSWLRIWLFMVGILADEGVKDEQLVIASSFVGQTALGLIMSQPQIQRANPILDLGKQFASDSLEQVLLQKITSHSNASTTRRTYDYGVQAVLASIRKLIGELPNVD
jgi:AcrR family transcriptional regulator